MVFNSAAFLGFFLLFFNLYWLINNKGSVTLRNLFILISSYVFYAWWDWRFLSLLVFISTFDYFVGLQLHKSEKNKRFFLIVSIVVNVGLLCFFKYFNFFIDSFNVLLNKLGTSGLHPELKIILPLGISFYIFQSLSYSFEIYRGKLTPTKNYLTLLSYISFFPQLVAGPIERATNLLPQFYTKKTFSYTNCVEGLQLALMGFFKKIVIADNLSLIVNSIFDPTINHNALTIFIGSLLFAIQLYCDFSGYSDIAIGLSKTLGFNLSINFKKPFFANSMTTLWQRWHISLSNWFNEYLFSSLNMSFRGLGTTGLCLAIFITFLVSGLWHGANYTFIIWGALQGFVICLETIFKFKPKKNFTSPIVFLAFALLLIPFKAVNLQHLNALIHQLIYSNWALLEFKTILFQQYTSTKLIYLLAAVLFFTTTELAANKETIHTQLNKSNKVIRYSFYYILLLSILLLSNLNINPYFIYFQY